MRATGNFSLSKYKTKIIWKSPILAMLPRKTKQTIQSSDVNWIFGNTVKLLQLYFFLWRIRMATAMKINDVCEKILLQFTSWIKYPKATNKTFQTSNKRKWTMVLDDLKTCFYWLLCLRWRYLWRCSVFVDEELVDVDGISESEKKNYSIRSWMFPMRIY